MGDKRIFVVAKIFNQPGSMAYQCKTINEARCLPGALEAIRNDGVQIVVLDDPDIYAEYAPYQFMDNIQSFTAYVQQAKLAT